LATVDPKSGGPVEAVLQFAASVARFDDACINEVVCLDREDAPFLSTFPLTVHAKGEAPSIVPVVGRFARHYKFSSELIPWLKRHAGTYDCVIVHGLWNFSTYAASRVLRSLTTPYFVFSHGMLDPWFRQAYPFKHLAKQAFWMFSEGVLLRDARAVLFTCKEERQQAVGAFFGFRYRAEVVPFGTSRPPAAETQDEDVSESAGRGYIVFLGRLHEKKGLTNLISAARRVADSGASFRFIFVGPSDSKYLAFLQAETMRLGLQDKIQFLGPLFGASKWAILRNADAFILPSHQENFGIAVAESLACGVPVLISDKVNIWREIKEAGAGLVEADTVDGTKRLIERWLALTLTDRQRMSTAASTLFSDQFDIDVTAPLLLEKLRLWCG
jgi:glycosyltransferase involved in cell wall biosynthesis